MTRHLLETQVMRRILSLPLFWKILMPAAVATICLSSYVAFSTLVFHRNNDRLEAVRDVHFPMLDAMTRNVAALDKLINGLNGAAAAGDADMLAATKPVADEIHGSYIKLQRPTRPMQKSWHAWARSSISTTALRTAWLPRSWSSASPMRSR
ncbi:hypothetical protein N8D55_20125 [Xanthomonas hortorum pv. pelargonii]|nr:hypothetical protein N8D55_20125 [Xanthomonas hortorum pv. pelargonii]